MQSLRTTRRTPPGPARRLVLGLLCALALLLHAIQAMAGGHAEAPMIHQTNIPMPMRDGVLLRADIWRPAGPGPFPALICRTPYGKDTDRDELRFARSAVARGYAVVIQDVRGRFASDGEFEPHRNEGRDGYDSIEWLAAQPWCDGRVGTFGLSYPGSAQWLAALEQPAGKAAVLEQAALKLSARAPLNGDALALCAAAYVAAGKGEAAGRLKGWMAAKKLTPP